jgi:hypothetical protein
MRNMMDLTRKAVLLMVAGALPALCPPGFSRVAGADRPASGSGEAGLQLFSGFWTIATAVRTNSSSTLISGANWTNVGGATVTRTVPQGTEELFEVTFTAKCRLVNASGFDAVRIRIVDNGQPVAEPYDGGQIFCSSQRTATYTGKWFIPVSAGLHTIRVEAQIFDSPPTSPPLPAGLLDDLTLELVAWGLGS